jgi:aryl-alcohol dehydrogenase-like predicted oxidoreductase
MGLPRSTLNGLDVSSQGLGCMGLSGAFGPADWDESIALIRHAISLGVTFLDTADSYAAGHNEVLVGRAIAGRRDEVQVATKFGIDRSAGRDQVVIRGERGFVKESCESSLTRLGVDHIDLYYMHRAPQNVQIEEAVGAMAELVAEGKVRYLGLSEVDDSLLRRACAVHPICAVQSEYSLWSRDPEFTVLTAMRELNVGLVPYSPLGRGFLTGTLDRDAMAPDDYRRTHPRFAGAAGEANQAIVDALASVAATKGATAAQVALAWVHGQSDRLGIPIVAVPGTKQVRWLEANVAELEITLDDKDLAVLDTLGDQVVGLRTTFPMSALRDQAS